MENIILEKVITFSTCIEKLEEINFKDSLDYKLNEDGVSALGIIKINGKIKTLKGYEEFDDSIDVDIYAPFEQIIEKDKFTLKVENVKHQIIRNNLILKITLTIEGFKRVDSYDDSLDDINLTNEIDDINLDNNPLYDDKLIDELNKNTKNDLEEKIKNNDSLEIKTIEIECKNDYNENNDKNEKTINNNQTRDEIVIKEESIGKNWANDLFSLNNSYVLFYRIHRNVDDENSEQKFILINEK